MRTVMTLGLQSRVEVSKIHIGYKCLSLEKLSSHVEVTLHCKVCVLTELSLSLELKS